MKVEVLDQGYVRLVRANGTEMDIVNAARVSYDKESDELTDKDIKLLQFLAREGHTSPFRHVGATFEVYAPLMVARQWFKYVVGSSNDDGWNESSRRYITEEVNFYTPKADEWRSAPENSKQGSGQPLPADEGEDLTYNLLHLIELGETLYNQAIARGVAPEQARLFLPAYGMYVRWRWTATLQSIAHLINQRVAKDSQYEFQQYAKGVHALIEPKYKNSLPYLLTKEARESL